MSYPAGERQSAAYPAYPGSGQPRPPRPPLTKRMRRSHWIAIDCTVAGFAALCDGAILGAGPHDGRANLPAILVVMAAVFAAMGFRRKAPVTAFAGLLVLGVMLSGTTPQVPIVAFLAGAFALYTVTVEDRSRTGIAALVLVLVVMVVLSIAGTGTQPRAMTASEFVPVALANVLAWMTGSSVRQRRLYAVTLQHQAASSAVAEERLRIARELHDVVAHSMSVIAVQAGYGQYVIDASPDGARHALGAIQATSRDALEEMRRMLGVLRQQDVADDAGLSARPAGTAAPPAARRGTRRPRRTGPAPRRPR